MTLIYRQPAPFLMKRKLFSFPAVHWMVMLVVLICLGFLLVLLEFLQMYNKKFYFFNLKSPEISTDANKSASADVLGPHTPTFVVLDDGIVFGTLKNLALPVPQDGVVFLRKESLQKDFSEKVALYPHQKEIEDSHVMAFVYKNKDEDNVKYLNEAYEALTKERKKMNIVVLDAIPAVQ